MIALFVLALLVAAFGAGISRSPLWAFAYVYVPTLLLVPTRLGVDFVGLPALTARRVVLLGICAALLARGRSFRWWRRPLDWLPLMIAVSFSISFWLITDTKGLIHKLIVLCFDWTLPFVLARLLIRDYSQLRTCLRPFAVCAVVVALSAVYEFRMAAQPWPWFWSQIGYQGVALTNWEYAFRWGYLRARGPHFHPLTLATLMTTSVLLMVLWKSLEPKRRWGPILAALCCVVGCLATISRGPAAVILLGLAAYAVLLKRAQGAVILIALLCTPLLFPILAESAGERIAYTETQLRATGNVESGHYRLALLLLYGRRISEVGFFGNPAVIGEEFERAWSIDNSYLYFFLIGGWCGGALFLALVVGGIRIGLKNLRHTGGRSRRVVAATVAAFVTLALCMANVWFADDYSPLLFVLFALILHQGQPRWFGLPARGRQRAPNAGASASRLQATSVGAGVR